MLNPDNTTLEWCAKWIEDSLRSETNERTIEFGKNMAMTIRAVKTKGAVIDSATSMRSACVEKVKTMISAGDERGWDDGYGQVWRQACTEIITELESLSIEQPKE